MSMRSEFYGPVPEFRSDGPTDEDMRLVNRWALKPLSSDDIVLFSMELCNNLPDSHYSQFPENELRRIATMVPGIPLMECHDIARRLPRGTFIAARVQSTGKKVAVLADFFVLRTARNADFIENVEGGVFRQTSIAFTFDLPQCTVCGGDLRECDHVLGQEYKGETCLYLIRNVSRVLEGSIVAVGSQQGTCIIGSRGLPICAKNSTLGEERLCSDCGECSCGKEDVAEMEPTLDVNNLDDFLVDALTSSTESPWLLHGTAYFEHPPEVQYDQSGRAFIEEIKAAAFDQHLSKNPEVRLLRNHAENESPLARTSDGSLRIKPFGNGVDIEADLSESTKWLLEDASGLSIGFCAEDEDRIRVPAESTERLPEETVYAARLTEISVICGKDRSPARRTTIEIRRTDPNLSFLKRRLKVAEQLNRKTIRYFKDFLSVTQAK